jgi:DNA-binding transcriptional ArsR family regulator
MSTDVFAAIVEPRRRQILDHLRAGPASVNELVGVLGMPQPAVSKHLRVLRDGGLVASQTAAQRRIYSLNHQPLEDVDAWLDPYRQLWERSLDALAAHLDRTHPRTGEEPR